MTRRIPSELFRRFVGVGALLCIIVLGGSIGYWLLTGGHYSMLNCLYMTVITITTIGYGEIIDLSHNPGGRVFTMAVAFSGIGTMAYLLSTFTAFVVEGELSETFRRRTMEKKAAKLEDHYIVCGVEKVGLHIVQELLATDRPCVVVDADRQHLEELAQSFEEVIYLDGDPTADETLLAAGIDRARGLFAAAEDDNQNLVVALTARQLNPRLKVVARCRDLRHIAKMKVAGADAVVSPSLIGGLRMASEMIRPTVVSFLDTMLRDKDTNLRIEEVPAPLPGKKISELRLHEFPDTLLLAVKNAAGWRYNPPRESVLDAQSSLIVMTTPKERADLEQHLQRVGT